MSQPIEPLIRAGPSPDDAVVVRGGPLTPQKIVEHAVRQQTVFSYRSTPMTAISVDLAIDGWPLERILRERMRSRSRDATATVGELRASGFELVATSTAPHFSVVRPTTARMQPSLCSNTSGLRRSTSSSERGGDMSSNAIEIDIPCDAQQLGELGMPFALWSEARDPARISVGAIVITADEEDPVFARVEAITSQNDGQQVVHLELLPGDPLDYADALRRSHLLLT